MDSVVSSPLLPGGDLVAALLDRGVMGLADRGGASGLVGARWADLCAAHLDTWPGTHRQVPGDGGEAFLVDHVARLDDRPAIAAAASRRALQNPDLLVVGRRAGRMVVQAADAKFSVETARSKQVSAAVLQGLLGLGELVTGLIGDLDPGTEPDLVEGVFLCPDFPLTHIMLRRRHGIVRTTVRPDQVVLVPVPAGAFFQTLEGAPVMEPLAGVDALPVAVEDNLLAALYYFRLARAGVGCWLDATGPLLAFNDRPAVDEAAVRAEAERRATGAVSAFELVTAWYDDVQSVRAQRAAVDQVAALPLMTRDLRERVAQKAGTAGVVPPSINQVRRRAGAWYRGQLRELMGPMLPPVPDFAAALQELGRIGASLAPLLDAEVDRVIDELLAQRPPETDGSASGNITGAAADGVRERPPARSVG
ncbi:MAG: hypothetical protein M3Q03_15690 [Chloroflexota bacterium]|nr:hypothetical protein [Chloroflexota bacterium]